MSELLHRPSVGTWIKFATTQSIEIVADSGFDFVVVDLEHTMLNLETAHLMLSLASASGMVGLVRLRDRRASTFQRVLDAGAVGVIVPHIDTVEQAAAAPAPSRVPPRGSPGAGVSGPRRPPRPRPPAASRRAVPVGQA